LLAGTLHEKANYVVLVFVLFLVNNIGGLGTVAAITESTEVYVLLPAKLFAAT
jgi:hypothetical protein